MDNVIEVLPDEVMQVPRYKGDWYLNTGLLDSVGNMGVPLPNIFLHIVRQNIQKNKKVREVYFKYPMAAK